MGAHISMAITRSKNYKSSTPDDSEDSPYASPTPSEEQQAHHAVDKISIGGIFLQAWGLSCCLVLVLCIAGVRIAYDANLANRHANWHGNSSQKVPTQMPMDTLLALPMPKLCQQQTDHIQLGIVVEPSVCSEITHAHA